MSVKSILFKGVIVSSGIVNFDGKDAKWLIKKAKPDFRNQLSHDNAKVAKHSITQDGVDKDGNPILKAVLKISKDCIRQSIFKNDQPFHNPGIVHAPKQLIALLSSVAGLLRGYMFADVGIKRKSAIYISDAVQTSNNVSTIDIGTQNSPKETKVDADADAGLTMHFKESIGGLVTYEFEGAIDLDALQFISLSQVHDRLAVDTNNVDAYVEGLKATLGNGVTNKAFYIKNTAVGGLPEEGILLNSDQVKVLVEEFFKRLLDLEITRGACGRAWLDSLEIMPKQSGLDNRNWIPITEVKEVSKAVDSVHAFYNAFNEAEALKLYKGLDDGKQKQSETKAAKKVAKNTTKKSE
jgi:cation transport regulator ChaB